MIFLLGRSARDQNAMRKEIRGVPDGIFTKVRGQTKTHLFLLFSKQVFIIIALTSLEFTVRPGQPQICSDPLASSCAQSRSHLTTTNHNLWLPASNHVHFTLVCPPNQKDTEGKTVKRIEGNVAGTYRQAACLALLQSCTEGWSMSTSLLLDLKPPRLGIKALTMHNPGSNKGVIQHVLPRLLRREVKASQEGICPQYHLYLCDCTDESS